MFKLILLYRVRKAKQRYAHLGYDIKPRVKATQLVRLVKPEWVSELYTPAVGSRITVNVRTRDLSVLVQNMTKVIEQIQTRDYIGDAYKVTERQRSVALDDWLLDKNGRDISATLATRELKRLVPLMSQEIAECKLSREDLYDYYQMTTMAYMEDAAEFLEAVLSLKVST
jgi:hypothetical protein